MREEKLMALPAHMHMYADLKPVWHILSERDRLEPLWQHV